MVRGFERVADECVGRFDGCAVRFPNAVDAGVQVVGVTGRGSSAAKGTVSGGEPDIVPLGVHAIVKWCVGGVIEVASNNGRHNFFLKPQVDVGHAHEAFGAVLVEIQVGAFEVN